MKRDMKKYRDVDESQRLIDEITRQVLLKLQEDRLSSDTDELLTEVDVRKAVKNVVTGGAIALAPLLGLAGKVSGQSATSPAGSNIVALTQKVAPGTVLDTVIGPVGSVSVTDIGKTPEPGKRSALDNVHGILSSSTIQGDFAELVGKKLKDLREKGYTPDVTDIEIKTTVSGGKVITTSECKIIQSTDGKAYTVFTTRGSIGAEGPQSNYEKRHDDQVAGIENRLNVAYGGSAKKVGDTHEVSFTVNGKKYTYHQSFYVASTGEDDRLTFVYKDVQNPYTAPKDTVSSKSTAVETPKPQTGTSATAAKPGSGTSTTASKPATPKADTTVSKPAVSKPSTGGSVPVKAQTATPPKSDTVTVKSPATKPTPAPAATVKPSGGSSTTAPAVQTPTQNPSSNVDIEKSTTQSAKTLSGTFTGSFTELGTRLEKEIKEALREIGGGIVTKYTPKVTKGEDGRFKFEVDWEVSKSDKGNYTNFIRGGLLSKTPQSASADIDKYLSDTASKLRASEYTPPVFVSNLNINLNVGGGYYWVEKIMMINTPIKESTLSRKEILRLKVLAGIEKDYI